MKAVLIVPKPQEEFGEALSTRIKMIPFGVLYVGSALKKAGHEVIIIDEQIHDIYKELDKHIKTTDFFGLSVMTAQVPDAIEI